jgi:hypothetical protein
MSETHVVLQEIPALCYRADLGGKDPPAAFDHLESKLLTLKGRKFYGTFRDTLEERSTTRVSCGQKPTSRKG